MNHTSNKEDIKRNRISNTVAMSVVILSTFLSISKVKDDNIVKDMQQANVNAVDTWSEYQAKKLKLHLAENSKHQTELLRETVGTDKADIFSIEVIAQDQTIQKYQKNLEVLQGKAKKLKQLTMN